MDRSPRVRVLFCDACGAPLDARAFDALVLCRYCSATNAVGAPLSGQLPDDGRPRLNLGGRSYVVEGQIGHGDACDVFRARWATRLGELVVLKVLRAVDDGDLLRAEWNVLGRLHRSADAATAPLAARLPQPIAFGPYRPPVSSGVSDGGKAPERWVAAYEWHPGFVHTLEDVRMAHPLGVDGRVGVWLLRRLLEVLAFAHRAGFVHGAVLPPHVLVHPRDHGAILVGWSNAVADGATARATSREWASWYGSDRVRTRRGDLSFAARCARDVVDRFASPVAELVERAIAGDVGDDAWDLAESLRVASRQAYGPATYVPLAMPGWTFPTPPTSSPRR